MNNLNALNWGASPVSDMKRLLCSLVTTLRRIDYNIFLKRYADYENTLKKEFAYTLDN